MAGSLRSVADKLAAAGEITRSTGERSMTIDPPDQATSEVTVERETALGGDSGELNLELEVEWAVGVSGESGDLTVE